MSEAVDPQDVRDFYEGRAALIEFDGGAPRRVAEIAAIKQTMIEFGLDRRTVQEIVNKQDG